VNTDSTQLRWDAVGLYVHVPFCESKCGYCGFYSERIGGHDAERYVTAVISEMDKYREVGAVETIYIGGGSPTSLGIDLLVRLVDAIVLRWPKRREFTVECNPGQVDGRMLSMLRERGVNRLSFGMQSFDDGELSLLGRVHRATDAVRSVEEAYESGFENVGVDLIFAIPGSTVSKWERSLQIAIGLGVQHVSAYSLSFEKGTAFEAARLGGKMEPVDEDTDREMYELAIDYLASEGLEQYEISNFARVGFECVHNQGYWDNRPYIGVGPAAGSYWQGRRRVNISDISKYIDKIGARQDVCEQCEEPGLDERVCETAVLNLRKREGVDLKQFCGRMGVNFLEVFEEPLQRYSKMGLIEMDERNVRLARMALGVADSVLCDFSVI